MKKPNINKENMIMIGVGTAFAVALISGCGYAHYCGTKNYENLQAEIRAAEAAVVEEERESYVVGFDYSSLPWKQMGYDNLQVCWDDIQEQRDSIRGIADKYIDSYGSKMTEEDKKNLRYYENRMLNAVYSDDFESAYNDFNSLASQFVPKRSYSGGGSYYYPSGSGVLTRSGGVNYYNGRKETWYSQRVLAGGGLNIPGRHVAEDGTIRDADGYICVAASDLPKGTVVETSLGTGKVYDTGCAAGTTDIYTDW